MIRQYFYLFFFLFAAKSGFAQKILFKGVVDFVSEAPLEIIRAKSSKLSGVIDMANQSFAFSVDVASFEGFNAALQKEHFHENYMESKKFPKLTYVGILLDKIDFTKDGVYECRSKGKFNIHGVEKERILKNIITIKNGFIGIVTTFNIALVDYKINIPKIVYKKIAEEINISVVASGTKP